MKLALIIGGPLILAIAFCVWSGIIVFGEVVDGIEHQAGTEPGGTFVTSDSDGETSQSDSFSETVGLEVGQEPIEYREGSESTFVRKLNGLTKHVNITIKWPVDWSAVDPIFWKWNTDSVSDSVETTPASGTITNEAGVEMIQIDPPTLVIPAN